ETIGLNPLRYVVATRLVACWICFPVFYFLVAGFYYLFAFLVLIFQIQEVSQGGWENVHWAFTTPQDALFGLIKLVVFGTVIAMLGMFYVFRARGGLIGVGTATA